MEPVDRLGEGNLASLALHLDGRDVKFIRIVIDAVVTGAGFEIVLVAPLLNRGPMRDGAPYDARPALGNIIGDENALLKVLDAEHRHGRCGLHSWDVVQGR